MTDLVQAIEAETQALAGDLEQAVVLAEGLGGALETADTNLSELQRIVEQMLASSTAAVERFQEQLRTQLDQGAQHLTGLAESATSAAGQIGPMEAETNEGSEAMRSALNEAGSAADALAEATRAATQELGQAETRLSGEIEGATSGLQDRSGEMEDSLTEVSGRLKGSQDSWTTFVGDFEGRTGEALKESAQSIDGEFLTGLSAGLSDFTELLQAVESADLSQPLQTLSQQSREAIQAEVAQVVDAAVAEMTELLQSLIPKLLGTKKHTDEEEVALQEIFEGLKPVFAAVESKFEVVAHIAGAVGVDFG